jgi:hypothetical protein
VRPLHVPFLSRSIATKFELTQTRVVRGYGGYDFGRAGYNPGGLGGPWSGLGVRPGLGLGGFGLRR